MDEFEEVTSSMTCDATMIQRAQVYSNYIENRGKKAQAERYQTSATASTTAYKMAKKSKLDVDTVVEASIIPQHQDQNQRCSTMMMANSSNSKNSDDGDNIYDDHEEDKDATPIDDMDPIKILISSYLGIDHFDNEEQIFAEFADFDCILVHLNSLCKTHFCFKGKCSILLVHGHVNTHGFRLEEQPQVRWYDLYSPETNSFVSISNQVSTTNQQSKNNIESNSNDLLCHQQVVNKLKSTLGNALDSNRETRLFNFLSATRFSPIRHSSLIAIRPLHSQTCNYLTYFDNFQHIYHSRTSLLQQTQPSRVSALFESIGVYPVPAVHFNAVRIASDEENEVFTQILNMTVITPKASHALNDNILSKPTENNGLVVMACGGKDVGKSTFLRSLVNSLLTVYPHGVAYLDCDPGQSEFTLSSCVSLSLVTEPLFGPPHTHIFAPSQTQLTTSRLISSYFLGHLSPNDAPGIYMAALRQCRDDFLGYKSNGSHQQQQHNTPLVINTMGWNQGLGLCLLKESIILFKPNTLVQINHPVEANKNMPILDTNWLKLQVGWPPMKSSASMLNNGEDMIDVDYKLITLRSYAPSKTQSFQMKPPQKRFSARDHRNIAVLAYFSRLFDTNSYFTPVHHMRPYCIRWSNIALHVTHSRVHYDQLLRVFNASLVALCHVDEKHIVRRDNEGLPGYLNDTSMFGNQKIMLSCLGFGIVRGISVTARELYLLTPEPLEVLAKCNLLAKGMLNMPLEFFYEQDSNTSCPYVSYSDNWMQQQQQRQQITGFDIANQPAQQRKYLIHQHHSRSSNQQ